MRATGRIQSSLIIAIAILGLVGSATASGLFSEAVEGSEKAPALQTESAARHEADAIRGDFWAPAGSAAERPEIDLEVRTWNPHVEDDA